MSFAMSAEAGREFDKLATALTTPRHSLTREVNLVVSLSRTPSLITSPFRSHLLPSYDRFALFVFSVRQRGAEAFNQLLFTHRRATSFPVAPALSDNRVPASVQNPGSHFSQRSDCSISSSCLSRSVNSIARRRNWRTTAARRCSSSARRSSRPSLCAFVGMVVAPRGLTVKLQTPGSVRLVR